MEARDTKPRQAGPADPLLLPIQRRFFPSQASTQCFFRYSNIAALQSALNVASSSPPFVQASQPGATNLALCRNPSQRAMTEEVLPSLRRTSRSLLLLHLPRRGFFRSCGGRWRRRSSSCGFCRSCGGRRPRRSSSCGRLRRRSCFWSGALLGLPICCLHTAAYHQSLAILWFPLCNVLFSYKQCVAILTWIVNYFNRHLWFSLFHLNCQLCSSFYILYPFVF